MPAARAAGMTMYEASMLKMEGRVSAASLKRNSLKRVESAPTHGLRARGKGFCSVCACGPVRLSIDKHPAHIMRYMAPAGSVTRRGGGWDTSEEK
eukprot:5868816-Prymnesium_polylepis.1